MRECPPFPDAAGWWPKCVGGEERRGLSAEIASLLEKTTTSAACDVLVKRGILSYLPSRIRPLDPAVRLAGPAVTVRRMPIGLLPRNPERPRERFVETVARAVVVVPEYSLSWTPG
jgi:regulator of RNase E activity RraA